VSKAALKNPAVRKLELAKPLVAVKNTRKIGKRDMKNNDFLPRSTSIPGDLRGCAPTERF
jgi:urease alpha subunit